MLNLNIQPMQQTREEVGKTVRKCRLRLWLHNIRKRIDGKSKKIAAYLLSSSPYRREARRLRAGGFTETKSNKTTQATCGKLYNQNRADWTVRSKK